MTKQSHSSTPPQSLEEKLRALAIRALQNMRGDDAARARSACRHRTPEQMQEQYGQSGMTYTQMLAHYEAHEAEINVAIEWVKSK